MRFCNNYRKQNFVFKNERYSLFRKEDIFYTRFRLNVFTTLNLAMRYYQVEMLFKDRDKLHSASQQIFSLQRHAF